MKLPRLAVLAILTAVLLSSAATMATAPWGGHHDSGADQTSANLIVIALGAIGACRWAFDWPNFPYRTAAIFGIGVGFAYLPFVYGAQIRAVLTLAGFAVCMLGAHTGKVVAAGYWLLVTSIIVGFLPWWLSLSVAVAALFVISYRATIALVGSYAVAQVLNLSTAIALPAVVACGLIIATEQT